MFSVFLDKLFYITNKIRKEGIILFNEALNTFYIRLYGVEHMTKDHSDSYSGTPPPTVHEIHFRLAARDLLYTPTHRQDSTAFVIPIAQWKYKRKKVILS